MVAQGGAQPQVAPQLPPQPALPEVGVAPAQVGIPAPIVPGGSPTPQAQAPEQVGGQTAPQLPPQPALPEVGVAPAQVGIPAPVVPGGVPTPQAQAPEQVGVQPAPQLPPQPAPQDFGLLQGGVQPQLMSAVGAQPQPVVPSQPLPPMGLMQPPMAPPSPAPLPEAVPPVGLGPDFGPLPDYIAEADASMADASPEFYAGVDDGSDDDDDGINDVDFGSAASVMDAPEAGVTYQSLSRWRWCLPGRPWKCRDVSA